MPIVDPDAPRAKGIDESDLYRGDDGTWYLACTAPEGVGLAVSNDFFGPYRPNDELPFSRRYAWEASELVAPSVLIEDGLLLPGEVLRVRYAEYDLSGVSSR